MVGAQVVAADDDGDGAAGRCEEQSRPGRPSCLRPRPRPVSRRRGGPPSRWPRSRRRCLRSPLVGQHRVAGSGHRWRRSTARPATSVPSDRRTTRCPASSRSEAAAHGLVRWAPNFSACTSGPLGEVAAGDPGREAEVVLDARAGPGLAPDGDHLDDQGSQSLGGAIDRRRQTGRPTTDDDEVETAVGKAVDGQPEVAPPALQGSGGAGPSRRRSRPAAPPA